MHPKARRPNERPGRERRSSVTRRRDRPDHLGLVRTRIAIAVRKGALESETVAGFEHDCPSIDPQFKTAPEHHAGFFAGMLVGLLPGGCARREATRKKLWRPRGPGVQRFVHNPGRVVEPAPPTAPHHKVTFFLGLVS